MIKITQINNTWLQITGSDNELHFIHRFFNVLKSGSQFSTAYKTNRWDGKISFFKKRDRTIFVGLVNTLIDFCKKQEYKYKVELFNKDDFSISKKELKNFIEMLNIPGKFEEREYQLEYVLQSLNEKRIINLSATGSGKSYMIYLLLRYIRLKIEEHQKILIIVPTAQLSEQLYRDFENYGWKDIQYGCCRIYSGMEKQFNRQVIISTWQSLDKINKEFLKSFLENVRCVIVDEVHKLKGTKLIRGILEEVHNADLRFGFTGTLDFKDKCDQYLFEGLIGGINQFVTTKELQDDGTLSKLEINFYFLNYGKLKYISNYDKELNFIHKHEGRKEFLTNKILSKCENNTLILWGRNREYGKSCFECVQKKYTDKEVYYIDGTIPIEHRMMIIDKMEKQKNIILVASYSTFSTGINLRNLHNIVLWTPIKAKITLLQSIGRGLRIYENKTLKVWDLCDMLFQDGADMNYTLRHGLNRLRSYEKEKFKYFLKKSLIN
jgi:superfamily II DNA or RNA helicase